MLRCVKVCPSPSLFSFVCKKDGKYLSVQCRLSKVKHNNLVPITTLLAKQASRSKAGSGGLLLCHQKMDADAWAERSRE